MKYSDLTVWQKSMNLTIGVYQVTQSLPVDERYGLTAQMRRCAVSIPSNIAEGSRRTGDEITRFLRIAYGSGSELETQLELCSRLSFLSSQEITPVTDLLGEVMRMLNVMINK